VHRIHPSTKKILAIGLLAALPTPLILAGKHEPNPSTRTTFQCYCLCNAKDKKRECGKVCDLPKYESRWWATSCKKRPGLAPRVPASPSHTPHSNWPEDARRHTARNPRS